MVWHPLHTHSHYSLHDAIAKPSKMAKRCAELGYPAVAITDHGNLGCAVDFTTQMDKVGIKPILGCEFNLCERDSAVHDPDDDQPYSHTIVLAKDAAGWKQLVAAVSRSASREHAFHGPRLDLEQFRDFAQGGHLIAITGHIGSDVANAVFTMPRNAYASLSREDIWRKHFDRADYEKKVVSLLDRYISIFGKENVFLEAQVMDPSLHPATRMVANVLRQVGPKMGLPIVATADVHYVGEDDASDHQVVLRSAMQTSLRKQATAILRHKDYTIDTFFKGRGCHHLPTPEEMRRYHTDEEIESTARVADMCEKYSILNQPRLPHFPCPDGMQPEGYLRELCERGWRDKVEGGNLPYPIQTYRDRLEMELDVINGAGLPSYFLIVQDFMNYGREHNWILGPGRGCLESSVPIVMSNGTVKPIGEIKVGDCVVVRSGEIRAVVHTHVYGCNEPLIRIKTYYGDDCGVTLTPDHKVLVEKMVRPANYDKWGFGTKHSVKSIIDPVGDLSWLPASEIGPGDWVFVPTVECGNRGMTIDLASYCTTPGTRYDDEFVYHERYNPLTRDLAFSRKLPRYLEIDEWWAELLGVFVGNGWLKSREHSDFGIAFNGRQKEKIDRVTDGLLSRGIDYSVRFSKSGNLCQIHVRNRVLTNMIAAWHHNYRSKASTKHVPAAVFHFSNEMVTAYIKGYFKTDGSIGENKDSATSASFVLAHQVRHLLRMIGIPSTIREDRRVETRSEWGVGEHVSYIITVPKTSNVGSRDAKAMYRWRRVPGGMLVQVRSVEQVDDVQQVHDLTVEDEHNYLTSSFLVHNSSAGCIVSWLIGVTAIDPVRYGLIFERFYNAGRNAPGRVSLPDIDSDVPKYKREEVYRYLQRRYGDDRVAKIATFASMQGRSAVTAVMSTHDVPFDLVKRITKVIPDKARITEELEEMRQRGEEPSIISYSLDVYKDDLAEWVQEQEDGSLTGEYAQLFSQARRLEGVKTHIGIHAAGVAIGAEPLAGVCPLKYDSSEDAYIAAMEWENLEQIGVPKFDVLATAFLDKGMCIRSLVRKGRIYDDTVPA